MTPKAIVILSAVITSCLAFLEPPIIKALCAQVILTPDDSKITVFNNGSPHGFNTSIPSGGQIHPIAIDGANEQWKKAQKKAKKNIISETINSIMPKRNPCWTFAVWLPVSASNCMSLNQAVVLKINNKNENRRTILSRVSLKLWVNEILCR